MDTVSQQSKHPDTEAVISFSRQGKTFKCQIAIADCYIPTIPVFLCIMHELLHKGLI